MPSQMAGLPLKASLLLFLSWSHVASAVQPNICARFNTADEDAVSNTPEQSNGRCINSCKAQYAYAITQDWKCWCSNYTPADDVTVDIGKCNAGCPSYPLEPCGGQGVFGYIRLNDPSGTKGAGSSPSSEPDSSSSSSSPSTSSNNPTTSKSTPSSTEATKSTPTTSMVQTVTVNGTPKTVTVAPTITDSTTNDPAAGENERPSSSGGRGLKTGAIAGIVIGVVALVLIAVGIFLFWFLRRRKQNQDEDYQDDPSVRGSSSGMMASHRPEMSLSGGSPASPGSAGNRNSMLQIDPRMDPFKQTLYARNGSTESVNTLRDDHDYSRRIQQPKVLRATNPDPE